MTSESASADREKRSLPRRILRWLVWTGAVVLALLAAAWAVLDTDWAREQARRLVEQRAGAALGREVTVGSVDFDVPSLSAEGHDIVIGGPRGLDEPLASVEVLRIRIGPGILGLLSGSPLVLREVVVSSPVVNLVFDEEGSSNLPDLGGDGRTDGESEVRLEALYVEDGTLRLEERATPLDLSALDVRAVLGEAGPGTHRLEASSERVTVELADAEPVSGAVKVEARIVDGGVTVESASLEAPHLSATVAGRIEAMRIDLDLSVGADAALLAELGWTDAVAGRLAGDLHLTKLGEVMSLTGDLVSPSLTVGTLELIELRGELALDADRLGVRLVDGRLAGGRIEGELSGALGHGVMPLEIALRVDGVDSTRLLEALGGAPASGIGGLLSAEVDYRFVADDPLGGSGNGVLELTPVPASSVPAVGPGRDWSLSGEARVRYDGGHLSVDGTFSSAVGRQTLLRAEAELPLGTEGAAVDSRFEVSGLDLSLLLAGVSDPPPLMGLRGLLSATASYRFPLDEPLAGEGQGRLTVVPPPGSVTGGEGPVLALDGSADVSVRDGVVSTSGASIAAPGQRIRLDARIDLPRSTARVDLDVDTEDLSLLLATMPALRQTPETEPWEPSRGRGRVSGTLAFEPGGFRVDLDLDLEDLSLAGAPIAHGAGHLSLDSAGVQRMDLRLEDGDARLKVAGTIPFEGVTSEEAPSEEPPSGYSAPDLAIDITAERWRLADAAPFLPFEIPLDGRTTGTVSLTGSFDAISGRLEATVEEMELMGEEVPGTLVGEADFTPDAVAFGPVRYSSTAGEVEVAGTYDPRTGRVDVDADASRLDLAAPLFRDRMPGELSGWVQARLTLLGTLERPDLELEITGHELALGETSLGESGDSRLTATVADGRVAVRGSLLGLVSLDGGGTWDEQGVDLEIGVQSSSMGRLAGLVMESPPAVTGALSGHIEMSTRGESVSAGLVLDHFELGRPEGEGGDNRLWNVEPIRISWTDQGLMLESLYLRQQGSDSELFARGLIGSKDTPMDLVIQSSIDAGWLTFAFSDLDVTGRVEVLASIGGTWAEPRIDGQSRVVGGRVRIENFPHAVDNIQGLIFLYPDRVVIDSGEASFARGKVTADGTVVITGEDVGSYELRLRGTDLDIRYPEEWRIRADAQMTLSSDGAGRLLSGVVEVDRATYARDFDLGFSSLVRAMFERRPDLVEETEEMLRETRLNINVRGEGALQIQTNIATLSGDLDFTLRGNLARPVMLGDVVLDRGGTVDFGGNNYTLERGRLTFSNPFRNEPTLDLVASTTVREFDVRLNVYGPVDNLETSFSSTPPLPSLDVVSLLTTRSADTLSSFGRTGLETQEGGSSAERFLASQAASLAGKRVGDLFGLDQVQITPLTGASSELSTARLTVGKRVSRDIYITYSYDPSQSDEEIVEVAWQLSPTIVLLLRATDQGSYTADVRWTKSF